MTVKFIKEKKHNHTQAFIESDKFLYENCKMDIFEDGDVFIHAYDKNEEKWMDIEDLRRIVARYDFVISE